MISVFSEANIQQKKNSKFQSSIDKDQGTMRKCRGHEVGIHIENTIQELDIPEENIETLLNYLEFDEHKYVQVLSKAYCKCKIVAYDGSKRLK